MHFPPCHSRSTRMKDNASWKRRRRWEGQARTIGDENMERRRRRRRRTQVSQAVITDIGSAIVGATKAHGPEASIEWTTEGNGYEDRGEVAKTRGREKDIGRGQRWLRIRRDTQTEPREISAHLDAPSFLFLFLLLFFSVVELYERRPTMVDHTTAIREGRYDRKP